MNANMTADDVKKAIASFDVSKDEESHFMEDNLWIAVLEAISEGRCDDPAELATQALKTRSLKFERWFA